MDVGVARVEAASAMPTHKRFPTSFALKCVGSMITTAPPTAAIIPKNLVQLGVSVLRMKPAMTKRKGGESWDRTARFVAGNNF